MDEVANLKAMLSEAERERAVHYAEYERLAAKLDEEREEVSRHASQREILNREPTGATADLVAELEAGAGEALRTVHAARMSSALLAEEARGTDAKARQAKAREGAERYREIAANIPQGLGTILAERGASGLTVIDGRLHRIDANGATHDFETRSSTGERIAAALTVAAAAYKGKVVPLSRRALGRARPRTPAALCA